MKQKKLSKGKHIKKVIPAEPHIAGKPRKNPKPKQKK